MKVLGRYVQALLLFSLLLGVFLVLLDNRSAPEIVLTATPLPTNTFFPTETATLIPTSLPTVTAPPPIVEAPQPQIIIQDNNNFNNVFYTATVCNNVPVFSQPASNFNLIIGNLYKGNRVDVTGQSQFWSRISYSMGIIGYVPTEYIQC